MSVTVIPTTTVAADPKAKPIAASGGPASRPAAPAIRASDGRIRAPSTVGAR
jgi:hypothetical protein